MERGQIKLDNKERFLNNFTVAPDKLDLAIKMAVDKLKDKLNVYTDRFPVTSSHNNRYKLDENNNWVCGMQTGLFLLAYELSGDEEFLSVAHHHLKIYENRIINNIKLDDHDVGFVFSPSCVAYYKLTGDSYARDISLRAAEYLYQKSYTEKGGFILRTSKGKTETKEEFMPCCRTMMDTMLNIPLFFWAGMESGEEKYTNAAKSQAALTNKYLIRADGSTYHHYQFELQSFKPLYGLTFQGNRDESTWSRGHSWGILGYPIAYTYAKEDYMPKVQRDLSYYFLNHLPSDNIPYWDFDFVSGDEPRDTSAAAISVCGMLEASKYMDYNDETKTIYKNAANMIIDSIITDYIPKPYDSYDGLITGVTAARRMAQYEVNACALYGDYFYLEALMRLKNPDWKMYW